MVIDKGVVVAALAGVVIGAAGHKIYTEHKEEILRALKKLSSAGAGAEAPEAAGDADIPLEELEAQKERLEDLIAEQKAK